MDFQQYEEKKLIEKREFSLKQIGNPLTRALKDLKTSRATLAEEFINKIITIVAKNNPQLKFEF